MPEDEALGLVCNTAIEWAQEYGFSMPEHAKQVFLAVYVLRPEALDPESRAWAEEHSR